MHERPTEAGDLLKRRHVLLQTLLNHMQARGDVLHVTRALYLQVPFLKCSEKSRKQTTTSDQAKSSSWKSPNIVSAATST